MIYDENANVLYRSAKDAGRRLKIMGLTEDNCADHGLVVPVVPEKPPVAATQTVRRSEMPVKKGLTWEFEWIVEDKPVENVKAAINLERDRRIAAGVAFNGKTFQSDPASIENIGNVATAALSYIVSGGAADEMYWQSPDVPFAWLAEDNTLMPMTPQMMIEFGNATLAHKSAIIFAARALKDMNPIPADFTDDRYWP